MFTNWLFILESIFCVLQENGYPQLLNAYVPLILSNDVVQSVVVSEPSVRFQLLFHILSVLKRVDVPEASARIDQLAEVSEVELEGLGVDFVPDFQVLVLDDVHVLDLQRQEVDGVESEVLVGDGLVLHCAVARFVVKFVVLFEAFVWNEHRQESDHEFVFLFRWDTAVLRLHSEVQSFYKFWISQFRLFLFFPFFL